MRTFAYRDPRSFARVFAFDLETFLIAPGRQVPPGVCLSYVLAGKGEVVQPRLLHFSFDRPKIFRLLSQVLRDDQTVVVGANVAFDLAVLVEELPALAELVWRAYDSDRVYCVQVAQKLADIATNQFRGRMADDGTGWLEHDYSLAGLARRHLGEELDKDTWRLRYGTLIDTPCERWPEGARDYSLLDSLSTLGVFESQLRDVDRPPSLPTQPYQRLGVGELLCDVWNQTRAQWWLHLMVARGIRTDPAMVAKLRELVEREVERLTPALRAAGLVKPGGKRSAKAARERMVAVCASRNEEPATTAKGAVKVTDDVCLASGDPELAAYAAYSSLQTILAKDLPALAKPLIQSRFDALVETGRTSCSGGGGGKRKAAPGSETAWTYQLQNVRRKLGVEGVDEDKVGVRQCFVPRAGYWFVSCDYSMQELCSWAQVSYTLCGMTRLKDALNEGRDVHLALGARLIGLSYEEALERKKEPRVKDARQMSKAGNFGFPGGLGWRSFKSFAKASYGLELSDAQAQQIERAWRKEWEPEPYFRMISALTEHDGGEVVHLFSGRRRAWIPYTVACNSYFQGLAADCSKDAGYRVSRACYIEPSSPLYGSRVVNFVHDELILEVPVERAHEAAHECARLMMEAGKRWMPDCPPKVEPALMTRWIKSAEPKYEEGRLVPWA